MPLWMGLAVGAAVLVLVLAVLAIRASSRDDSP